MFFTTLWSALCSADVRILILSFFPILHRLKSDKTLRRRMESGPDKQEPTILLSLSFFLCRQQRAAASSTTTLKLLGFPKKFEGWVETQMIMHVCVCFKKTNQILVCHIFSFLTAIKRPGFGQISEKLKTVARGLSLKSALFDKDSIYRLEAKEFSNDYSFPHHNAAPKLNLISLFVQNSLMISTSFKEAEWLLCEHHRA